MASTLPKHPYVTLSESLTWLAFSDPHDRASLNEELAGTAFSLGIGPAKARLTIALDELMNAASASKLELRGKHLLSGDIDPASVKVISVPAIECGNYRQFDITLDALRFGSGLAWLPDEDGAWAYASNKRPEFFAEVTVSRSGLMHTFSSRVPGLPATAKGKLPPLPQAQLQNWWDKLTPDERSQSQNDLHRKCREDHPSHNVQRQRIRDLTPDRQPGPKANAPKNSA